MVLVVGSTGFVDGEPAAPPELTGVVDVAAGGLFVAGAGEPARPDDPFGALTGASLEAPSSEPHAAQTAVTPKTNATLDFDQRVAELRCIPKPHRRVMAQN
jgi:hypothetical protein